MAFLVANWEPLKVSGPDVGRRSGVGTGPGLMQTGVKTHPFIAFD